MRGRKSDSQRRVFFVFFSTPICTVLSSAGSQCSQLPLRPPPAAPSFEVIMGLLANAPLQVPPAPSHSPSPSVATLDERR